MNEIHKRYVALVPIPVPRAPAWLPCVEWCEQNIKSGWWYINEGIFEFNDEKEHLMFILRWS